MRRRAFGRTGLEVSERSFGAWAIGGQSYGAVDAAQALSALAEAEALGCNFVDTAAVYGDSEALLGRFLPGRRDRWLVASKYSGQAEGMTALVESQLRRLATDRIDFHQIHWAPDAREEALYDELDRLKRAGKVRFCGVSLKSAADIDRVLAHPHIDGIQLPVSLLDPEPLASRRQLLRDRGVAVIARSALRGGFLAGSYREDATFSGSGDQRSEWPAERIRTLARQASAFAYAAEAAGSPLAAALAYPLSFPEVSTLVMSCKSAAQARANFDPGLPATLDDALLARIAQTQRELGLFSGGGWLARVRRKLRQALR
jgi:aryl-alcohol dehydrogenase-like predicted oxidoreductase